MPVPNVFNAKTTRQLSIMLLAAGGALTFSAFNMIAAGVASDNHQFVADVASSFIPLKLTLFGGFVSFLMSIAANQPSTPENGGRWSKRNLLQSAFALLAGLGLFGLVWATVVLFDAAKVTVG